MGIRDSNIREHLLKPLSELFGSISAEKEAHYLESLKSAIDTELKEIFVHLRDNYEYTKFPPIAEIQKARKEISQMKAGFSNTRAHSSRKYPWEERAERIDAAVKAYWETFKNSVFYSQCVKENIHYLLEVYIKEVANVQTQIIERIPAGVGYDCNKVFGYGFSNIPEIKQKFKTFLDECRQQAETGRIEVTVPNSVLDRFRKEKIVLATNVAEASRTPLPDDLLANAPRSRSASKSLSALMPKVLENIEQLESEIF